MMHIVWLAGNSDGWLIDRDRCAQWYLTNKNDATTAIDCEYFLIVNAISFMFMCMCASVHWLFHCMRSRATIQMFINNIIFNGALRISRIIINTFFLLLTNIKKTWFIGFQNFTAPEFRAYNTYRKSSSPPPLGYNQFYFDLFLSSLFSRNICR